MTADPERERVAQMVAAYNDFLRSIPITILPGVVQPADPPLTAEQVAEVGPWMGRMAREAKAEREAAREPGV